MARPGGGTARILVTTPTAAPVELWRWDLGPGESYQSHPHLAGLVETVTVISGTAVVTVDGTDYPLRPGLTAVYGGDAEHSVPRRRAGRRLPADDRAPARRPGRALRA